MPSRPENPAGPYVANPNPTAVQRLEGVAVLRNFPARLRRVITGWTDSQLEKKYRNWTVRQIVNHLADSHVNAYVRFKLTLTEERPTIKPYDETAWSNLRESQTTDVNISLQLLDALHARWVRLIELMTEADFARTYFHPEYKTVVPLGEALGMYAWHCNHHLAQIEILATEQP